MSFGIQVKNIYGDTQIDGLYKNFQVQSYGVSNPTVASPDGFGFLCPVYANFNSGSPIVMGRNVGTYSGNSLGASAYYYPENTINVGADTSLKYVILEPIPALPTPGAGEFGLEIFNPSGLVVFSSRRKNFIIDAVITLTSYSYNSSHDVTLPAVEFGERYYQMLVRCGNQTDGVGYGIIYSELSPTLLRVYLSEAIGATGPRTVSFITGYFQP